MDAGGLAGGNAGGDVVLRPSSSVALGKAPSELAAAPGGRIGAAGISAGRIRDAGDSKPAGGSVFYQT